MNSVINALLIGRKSLPFSWAEQVLNHNCAVTGAAVTMYEWEENSMVEVYVTKISTGSQYRLRVNNWLFRPEGTTPTAFQEIRTHEDGSISVVREHHIKTAEGFVTLLSGMSPTWRGVVARILAYYENMEGDFFPSCFAEVDSQEDWLLRLGWFDHPRFPRVTWEKLPLTRDEYPLLYTPEGVYEVNSRNNQFVLVDIVHQYEIEEGYQSIFR